MCLARNDRLRPFADVAAPDAVHVEARTDANTLQRREALLARERLHAQAVHVFLRIVRRPAQHLPVLPAELDHVVVEALDGDVAVIVDQRIDHLAERVDRIVDRTAVVTRVQVLLRSFDRDLHVGDAAHAAVDGRDLLVEHRRVGDQDDVAGQQFLVRLDPFRERRRTHFFLTFEDELDVVPELPSTNQIFESLDVHERLALVVIRTPRIDGPVADLRLEGRGDPQVERIDRHHVVVAVDQDGRQLRIDQLFAVDHRVSGRLHDLGLVGPGSQQQLGQTLGTTIHVGLVCFFGTDGRNAEQREQFVQEALAIVFNVLFHRDFVYQFLQM